MRHETGSFNCNEEQKTLTMFTNLILGVAPLDLSATGTEMAGYVATAAGAGVALLAALYGVRVIIKAFKGVK
jgi:hypothetical protein